ncbi:tetratricopeptide repeat protein [Aliiruegeria sabulilitoris]|uniref:tetratricopeptide repeat protein n=1 Tax=Aliiruegeria sabulilitoris TaxID=1510458 RepID=UPI00082C2DB4|nr:hypothetical protein [Aliiruegeria sabulilitoris]NDR56660.1 hypothetical protein [Pseudoruegeria sp. M32A2M]
MPAANEIERENGPVSKRAAREALDRVINSSAFENAGRLQAFLSYVVDESLADRGNLIAGKTIAEDVYEREPDDGGNSIVRVDAGRLRRKLAEYYDDEGASDPIRIHVDSGGYAPRFELFSPGVSTDKTLEAETDQSPPPTIPSRRAGDLIGLLILAGLAAFALILWYSRAGDAPQKPFTDLSATPSNAVATRTALAEKSVATLQAANLAEKASELLFPIADANHQKLATAIYREAIAVDPSFSGGYAGAAHSLGTLALISPDADLAAELLSEGSEMAKKAIDLDPLSGWSHSAAAWIAFAGRDYDTALEASRRAVSLSPTDGQVLDFSSVIAAMTGHFEEALLLADPERPRNSGGRHPAYLNMYGVANYHIGQHARAIVSFDNAVRMGGPVSELTLMYKAAAQQAAGRTSDARDLLDELQETWPAFRPGPVVKRFYQNSEDAGQLLSDLAAAGWSMEP